MLRCCDVALWFTSFHCWPRSSATKKSSEFGSTTCCDCPGVFPIVGVQVGSDMCCCWCGPKFRLNVEDGQVRAFTGSGTKLCLAIRNEADSAEWNKRNQWTNSQIRKSLKQILVTPRAELQGPNKALDDHLKTMLLRLPKKREAPGRPHSVLPIGASPPRPRCTVWTLQICSTVDPMTMLWCRGNGFKSENFWICEACAYCKRKKRKGVFEEVSFYWKSSRKSVFQIWYADGTRYHGPCSAGVRFLVSCPFAPCCVR